MFKEYWPTWVWYVLISPALCWHAVRHRSVFAWLACNPGIECGGGWVGESKWAILRGLGTSERVVRSDFVGARERIDDRVAALEQIGREWSVRDECSASASDLISHDRDAGRDWEQRFFPVILKPDVGERGHSVKLVGSLEEAKSYFELVKGDVIVQAFHPGPHECGVLWARRPVRRGETETEQRGFIYSITAKEFPVLTCDGESTLEELILWHPRFRRQHRVFLSRFAGDAKRVMPRGHVVRLGVAGNHCQGTLFRDGGHLLTPELERVIDEIARRFGESTGQVDSLDFARFDIRYESDEMLREGRGFVIIEANGTSAESTNIYDPARSLWWAMKVLVGQWVVLIRLGLWRTGRDDTHTPPREVAAKPSPSTLRSIMSGAERLRAARGGSAVSD